MIKSILKNLGFWILAAMVAGIAVGVAMGDAAAMFKPLGDVFIQLIKMLVVPLVAVSIISGALSVCSLTRVELVSLKSVFFASFVKCVL